MHSVSRLSRAYLRRIAAFLPVLLALCFQTGCTRSLRQEGAGVAQAGSSTAKQLGDYYDTLAQDTIRVWELNAYSDAYANGLIEAKFDQEIQGYTEALKMEQDATKKAELENKREQAVTKKGDFLASLTRPTADAQQRQEINQKTAALEAQLQQAQNDADIGRIRFAIDTLQDPLYAPMDQLGRRYQRYYKALQTRQQLAQEMQGLYDNFARLTDYNAEEDVRTKAGTLLGAVKEVLHTPMPDVTPSSNTLLGSALGDLIQELENVQQSRAIRRESRRILPILHDLQTLFDNEKVVYKSIPSLRASYSVQITKELVSNKAVISTALLNDLLAAYDLRWPEPQAPFPNEPMIQGIIGMITARSKPLEKASQDTADSLSTAMTKLIRLHEQLLAQKPLSFSEFVEASGTVQLLLAQLKAKNVDSAGLLEFLKQVIPQK